jgi:hypothetical protein
MNAIARPVLYSTTFCTAQHPAGCHELKETSSMSLLQPLHSSQCSLELGNCSELGLDLKNPNANLFDKHKINNSKDRRAAIEPGQGQQRF